MDLYLGGTQFDRRLKLPSDTPQHFHITFRDLEGLRKIARKPQPVRYSNSYSEKAAYICTRINNLLPSSGCCFVVCFAVVTQ
jgi:hypothetical protein